MSAYNELQLSSFVDQIFKRVQAIEDQLALLSRRPASPSSSPPVLFSIGKSRHTFKVKAGTGFYRKGPRAVRNCAVNLSSA